MTPDAGLTRSASWAKRSAAFALVIALSIYIFSIRDQIEALSVYGYPGVFLFALLTSATVLLPAPGLIVVFSLGGVLNPLWVGVAAGLGATLGELTGYLAGFSGRVVVENTQTYNRIQGWMDAHVGPSSWLILALAFLPLPFMDMAGMAAGALRMSIWRFQIWCLAGKIPKMLLVAWLGTLSVGWIEKIFLQ